MKTNKIGFYTAISTVVLTLVTFSIAITTLPLSGPYCKAASCYLYPYLDTASRFPRDYYWMYPAMFLMVAYLVLMVCIHRYAKEEQRTYSLVGLLFALMSTLIFLTDYFVQISVVQPSLLNGETDGISLLTQFNAHGIFIVLEELGYLVMAIGFAFMAPVFSEGGIEKKIRWTFILAFALTLIAFMGYSLFYGMQREYRFEVASITINWIALIFSGIFLAKFFRKNN